MSPTFEQRLRSALGESCLAEGLPAALAPFTEGERSDAPYEDIDDRALLGLARALASRPDTGRFLSHRSGLMLRLAALDADALADREAELGPEAAQIAELDLEDALDALRVRRREEMIVAACADLGGLVPFSVISRFLSILAETTTQCALSLARSASGGEGEIFSVIGMGKIAGREFTYHSDLDLIFLYSGGPERMARASRMGQRLIAYLMTMTGAGVAYAVDTRLRPSGQQGMLVTSYDAFERYQTGTAETWEHLAMLRARAIAGDVRDGEAVLARVRTEVLQHRFAPWPLLAELRDRVERERAPESKDAIALKTGPGGLMDVDFLAGGGLLERGTSDYPEKPSVEAMLRACVNGSRVDRLIADYDLLRSIEARARWIAGRGVEQLQTQPQSIAILAELVLPGLSPAALLERVGSAQTGIREAWSSVVAAASIAALED